MSFGDQMIKLFYIGPLFNRPSSAARAVGLYFYKEESYIDVYGKTAM